MPARLEKLLPLDLSVRHLPEIILTESSTFYMQNGQAIRVQDRPDEGLVLLKTHAGEFWA